MSSPIVATCFCGDTKVTLPHLPDSAKQCNCSFCSRAGATWAYFPAGSLTIESKSGRLVSEESVNKHYFCGRCGMHTHGDTPDYWKNDGSRIENVNLNMIDNLDWSQVTVEKIDGRNQW